MKKNIIICSLIASVVIFLSFKTPHAGYPGSQAPEDSLAADRARFAKQILDSLQDKKTWPADSVFHNLKTFTGSQRLLVTHLMGVMKYWGEALGVSCNYCHDTANWASDALRTKRLSREMYTLRGTINDDILAKMTDFNAKLPAVNCGTCHHGQAVPSRN